MKNYKVESIMKFTDKEENIKRVPYDKNLSESENEEKGSIFYCTKERYEFLKANNAVKLVEVQETIDEVIKKEITEKEVQAVANTIVEEAEEQDKTIEEVVNEIVEESKEEVKEKPKKKKTNKK